MVVWGKGVFSLSNRGRFQTVDESSCGRRVEPEDFPQDRNGVGHLGDVIQGDGLVPENLVDFGSQFEEDVRTFQELIGQKCEHRYLRFVST